MELTLKSAIAIGLKITIILLMLSLGMETSRHALLQLWRQPRLLAGSLVAAFLVVPLVTYGIIQTLPLSFGTKAGLWAISITPGAPMIYRAAMKRGIGNPELAASFQVTVALLVIVLAPAWLAITSAITGGNYGIAPTVLLKQVSTIQFIPILVGMALHRWQPGFTERTKPVLIKIGIISLIVLVGILLTALGLRILATIQIWTIIAAVLLAASAIISAHLLTGPEPATRLTIANANAQRNLGLALIIAAFSVPKHHNTAAMTVIVYAIIGIVMTALYTGKYGKSST